MFELVRRSTIVTLVAYVLFAIGSSTVSVTTADGGPAPAPVASANNIDWC